MLTVAPRSYNPDELGGGSSSKVPASGGELTTVSFSVHQALAVCPSPTIAKLNETTKASTNHDRAHLNNVFLCPVISTHYLT